MAADNDDNNNPGETRVRRLKSVAVRLVQRMKAGHSKDNVGQRQINQNTNLTAVVSTGEEEAPRSDPLLVRRKRYRPRLFHPMESTGLSSTKAARRRKKKEKKKDRALASDDVPAFLRKEERDL